MKRFFIIFAFIACLPSVVFAQNEFLDITPEPICFTIRNTADFRVLGNVSTDYFMRPDGIRARHSSNFRLQSAGSVDSRTGKPDDRMTACSSGPFLPGRKLDFQLKTIIPVFSCRTRVDQGEIIVVGNRRADDSGVEMRALCFD